MCESETRACWRKLPLVKVLASLPQNAILTVKNNYSIRHADVAKR